eukprot:TRINITY_DN10481_c0_g1_i2.p1 TRINITY_DN10481_c0_g1~~TRINITY_DN10481_c0_g1_i2.p1  ORF type:complete len:419 (+),score=79.19 TRINITY_DN10481_c0_g1_i2:199-1455(+)
MSRFWTSFAWLAGPISGFLQPVAGTYSDRCELSWGRRRPFVLAGLLIALAGFVLFANPDRMASWVGGGNTTAIVLAICSLWVLNIGLNLMQGTAWTIVIDRVPRSQQMSAQSLVSFLGAFASVGANLCGMINFVAFAPFFEDNNHAVFYIGAVVLLATTLPTLLFADERTLEEIRLSGGEEKSEDNPTFTEIIRGLFRMPRAVFYILIGFFLTNAAFSPYLFYFTDWMGTDVYGGDPTADSGTTSADLYDQGVRMGSLGMGLNNIVTMVYSLLIPYVQNYVGIKPSYSFVHALVAVCFLLPLIPAMQHVVPAEIIAAASGFLNAAMNVTPYALLGETVNKTESGLYMGVMNTVQVMGQLVANFIASTFMYLLSTTTAGIAVGGVFAAIGAVAVWILILPEKSSEAEKATLVVNQGPAV